MRVVFAALYMHKFFFGTRASTKKLGRVAYIPIADDGHQKMVKGRKGDHRKSDCLGAGYDRLFDQFRSWVQVCVESIDVKRHVHVCVESIDVNVKAFI